MSDRGTLIVTGASGTVGDVLLRAVSRAAELAGKDPATFQTIKQRIYVDALEALRAPLEGF